MPLPFLELAIFGRHGVKSENGEQALAAASTMPP
jgi:hypothetical protein